MDKYKFRKLLKRYQDGSANETEKALVEAWYQSYPDENMVTGTDARHRIFSAVNAATKPPIQLPRRQVWQYFSVAAAVLLVSAIGFIFYLRSTAPQPPVYATLQTHTGEIKRITLDDSSVVWLNASSRIRYPQQFNGKLRELYLDNGEAFFEIKHKTTVPFIVHVQKLEVQVLGTSFNINAYSNADKVKVMVATGKVGVSTKGKPTEFLTPGQQLTYNNIQGFMRETVDTQTSQSWKSGYTYLNQAPFTELAGVIKNQLGVTLKAGSRKVSRYRFTIRIQQNLPLDQTLQMITQIHNTHYRKEGDEIIIY